MGRILIVYAVTLVCVLTACRNCFVNGTVSKASNIFLPTSFDGTEWMTFTAPGEVFVHLLHRYPRNSCLENIFFY